jgi:Protein of unknown function (DUF3142)
MLRIAISAAAFICFAQISADARTMTHEAYVWQRLWAPPVRVALAKSAGLFVGWRVLAAETDTSGRLQPIAVDWAALAATRRPVVAVVRIDGTLARWDAAAMLNQIQTMSTEWKRNHVAQIEIDYDCGTARLESYAQFLTQLRKRVPSRLSVTALPAWLNAPQLQGIVAAADELVLQVHAVRAPQAGLFDPDLARHWIDMLSREDAKQFRVALPDYGTRIVRDSSGTILAVESEMPRLAGGASADELMAKPTAVASLLRNLQANPPGNLAGIVWFRLPVAGDTRIWSASTLRAVVQGSPLHTSLTVKTQIDAASGALNISLSNDGDIDAELPPWVDLPPSCALADGINGYSLIANHGYISLERLKSGMLYAHREQVIGWARCTSGTGEIHVRK